MKSADYNNSAWYNESKDDLGIMDKVTGGYYIEFENHGEEFTSIKDIKEYMKEEGYKHVGWD